MGVSKAWGGATTGIVVGRDRRCLGTQPRSDPLDDISDLYEGLEPAAAREREIPRIVWLALVWTLFGGIVIPLVLGIIARRRIKASNGRLGGLALANIAIALNLVSLTYIVFVIGPPLWKALT